MSQTNLPTRSVLVTGATGFVGRAVCGKLLDQSIKVHGAVRGAGNLTKLPAGAQAVSIDGVGPDTDWSAALLGVDTVIHLAARVHVMDDTSEDPLVAYRQVNVAGTENLARQAVACGVKRLVFISTVKVHGEECDVTYTEDSVLSPQDPYGVSKLEAEVALQRIADETGLEVVIIRPPLVYGPGVKANFLRLLGIVDRGIPLPFASIDNRRSLVYLGNLVDAISLCATHSEAGGHAFLVSDGDDVSTPVLIRRLAKALQRPARLIPFPTRLMRLAGKMLGKTNAVDRLVGSLTLDKSNLKHQLGWQPPFTMAEGLAKTAIWYKSRPRI
ncbi:MAG: SDR family oxidoreductase [Desulfuromusa sp.]|jgi:nucleoside-diphosphate-sugar epimerase|nr:SDR family oxidoreductase [Desulfuromusa sp.]